MDAFIDLVRNIFPTSIPPFTADKAKESLKQFKKENKFKEQSQGLGKEYDFFDINHVGFLRQGDIISGLNYFFIDKDGGQRVVKNVKMMLISNTCDASRDEFLHFAPLIPIENYLSEISDENKKRSFETQIYNNTIFRFIYLPHRELSNYVVNLNLITSIPLKIVNKRIEDGMCEVKYSLNTIGFFFLLCKLAVYFMREEKPEETERDKFNLAIL